MTAIYPRVSTAEQAENGHSIDEQTERMKKYCEAMGWDNVRAYTDAGFSGGNMERPALQQLIRDVKAGKVKRVLVYKLDRLSRSQLDTLYLIEKVFLANGCDFVSMSENFDTGTPLGRAMIGILAVFAQLEREQIKERLHMGKEARAKQGKFHGSATVPIGYDYKDGELVTNQFEKQQIIQIFEDYAGGMTPPAIAEKLNAAGMYQKGKRWLPYTVRQILARRTYLGYTFFGGEWYKGTHEAFISEELFDRVQQIRGQRAEEHEKHNRRSGKANSYLGGFLYCASCGAKYIKVMRYYKGAPKYKLYECTSRAQKCLPAYNKNPHCRSKIWNQQELEALVFGEIKKLALDPAFFDAASDTSANDKAAVLSAQRAEIAAKIEKLMDLYTDGEIPRKTLDKRVHDLHEQAERIAAELDAIAAARKEKTTREQALPLARGFGDVLDRGELDEVRAMIGALIEKIVLDGEDVRIYWRF